MAENTKKLYVLDASAVLAVILPDEKCQPEAERLLGMVSDRRNRLLSSLLLEFEFGNALRTAVKRGRLMQDSVEKLIENFRMLSIKLSVVDLASTLSLAIRHNLSYYDAAYLQLSRSNKAELLSLDEKLIRLAREA